MMDGNFSNSRKTTLTRLERLLKQWGAAPEEALRRLLNDHDFYKKLLGDFLNSREFRQLDEAIRRGDTKGAFMAAHSLKGASATLGLIPLTDSLSRLVEDLRGKEDSYLLVADAEYEQETGKFMMDLENCRVERSMFRRILEQAEDEEKTGAEPDSDSGSDTEPGSDRE